MSGQLTLPLIGNLAALDRERTDAEILASWNEPGPPGFYRWLADVKPKVIQRDSTYRVFNPTEKQKEHIAKILEVDEQGTFKHTLSLIVAPRRHGKSLLFCLLLLWLTTSRANHITQLLGSIASHCLRTMYRPCINIIKHTPALRKLIPDDCILSAEIHFKPLNSSIQMIEGSTLAGAFGSRVSCLYVGDLHSHPDLAAFNALQASTLDSASAVIWVCSNVDYTSGPVHGLQRESESDPGMYCDHIHYRDLKEYRAKAPLWLDRERAKRLKRTSLPADWKRDILGQRSSVIQGLFSPETIKKVRGKYRAPVVDIKALIGDRAYRVAGALDRSKSLLTAAHKDNTVWTTVCKTINEHNEYEIFVLNQRSFTLNLASSIKETILRDHERYGLSNICFENYETSDLYQWALVNKLQAELVSPTDSAQNISFPELGRLAREGRLHAPANLAGLYKELKTFTYEYAKSRSGNKYIFGSQDKKKWKDDRIYSLNWAVYALRKAQLSMYVIKTITCHNRTPKHRHCFIIGGDLEMYCSEQCPAYQEISEMWKQYRQLVPEDELTLQQFYKAKVKRIGALVRQAA